MCYNDCCSRKLKEGVYMNRQESDLLKTLCQHPFRTQRMLADASGHSLGVVNRSVKSLLEQGYVDEDVQLTERARQELQHKAPQRAILLAAGFGMRMVPINMEIPKALLKINGETLIERQIKQLHDVGITEIYVVVGFMKEQFEYLMDDYGVELIVNAEYAKKNNLHSLKHALEYLSNAYVVPCDLWCEENPFSRQELYSWYMVSDAQDQESEVRVNRKMELVQAASGEGGNAMVGISYLLREDAAVMRERVLALCADPAYDDKFWEEALYQNGKMMVAAKVVPAAQVVEVNTYEQLRELDGASEHLQSKAIHTIAEALQVPTDQITHITALKKGMTNRSFLFTCKDQPYIMRIPGEGTDQMINRAEEADVYYAIQDQGLCDDIVYINPENGYKITKYLPDSRVCDPFDREDVAKCMAVLRRFHEMELKVGHSFDIFGQIEFYESLWDGVPSVYRDYAKTKEKIFSLRPYIEQHIEKKVLTHIDAVPDNFLFTKDAAGNEDIRLIDWEYAGMQDPHVDIAMFCIYALYDKPQVDALIDLYFDGACPVETRIKIYAYIAACGLLWSNWCEYKQQLGVEFGEYSLKQYRFAKDYYRYAVQEMKK